MTALLNSEYLYVASDKYATVAAWAASTAYAAGTLVRQLATPAVGSERVFVCIVAGTSGGAEPTFILTKGAKTTDNTVTWQEVTGQPPVNGDVTNTLAWTASAKSNTVVLGQIIKNDAASNYQICTTAGTCGSGAEPAFSDTAGVTTADNTVTWTSLGVVGNFGAWAAPHARILNADSATWQTVVGSTIYISNAHAETQAAAIALIGGIGTISSSTKYLCVSNSVAPPTATTTGATVSTTGANEISINKFGIYVGIAFNNASGAVSTSLSIGNAQAYNNNNGLFFENCIFALGGTSGGEIILGAKLAAGNGNPSFIQIINSGFTFSSTGSRVLLQAVVGAIINCSFALTGTVPAILFKTGVNASINVTARDCDLSTITGTLLNIIDGAQYCVGFLTIMNSKLGAAVAMISGTRSSYASTVLKLHNCDSGTKNYRFYDNNYFGTVQQDTTTYNNAGATDGTTRLSWNIASASTTKFYQPLQTEYLPIAIWQEDVGSPVTATVEIAGAATLTNADIWMELEYLGSAATPIGTVVNNRAANIFATPANVPSSSASWSGSPAVTQKLQITFTPQMKGVVKARIYVAKASTTVYIDPLITIAGDSSRQYLIPGGGFINETGQAGQKSNSYAG